MTRTLWSCNLRRNDRLPTWPMLLYATDAEATSERVELERLKDKDGQRVFVTVSLDKESD